MPLGFRNEPGAAGGVLTAIENTIIALVENDITCQHVIIAPGKWDIPAYLGEGTRLGASISYHVAVASPSVPHSLDRAFPFTADSDVVLAFPDIVFRPREALRELAARRMQGDADVTLALVPSSRGDKVDLVSFEEDGRVVSVTAKPGAGMRGWTWVSASWGSRFAGFMHRHLAQPGHAGRSAGAREIQVADILNAAVEEGLVVRALPFDDGEAIDIGTPDDLADIWIRNCRG